MNKRTAAIIIFSGIILILFILSIVHLPIKSSPDVQTSIISIPTPIPVQTVQKNPLSFVQHNKNTIKTVINKLGTPSATISDQEGSKILIYNPEKNTQFRIYTNQTQPLVATQAKYKKNVSLPSSQEYILYDVSYGQNYKWHLFPQDGIGFLIDSYDNSSVMTQYFPPMTYATYLQSIANLLNLSETIPTITVENFK